MAVHEVVPWARRGGDHRHLTATESGDMCLEGAEESKVWLWRRVAADAKPQKIRL